MIISSGKRVATCVVKSLQDKLSKSNVTILMGTILNLCPLSYLVTVKEITPCLCLCYVYVIFVYVNFCLNTKLLYKLLIEKATKDNHDIAESRTSFFMNNFNCSKAENGYFCWKCFNMECSDYKITKPMHLKCIDSLLTV